MNNNSMMFIQQLLKAEEEAEQVIRKARDNRARKLQEATQAAEDEIRIFRKKEEEKFVQEQKSYMDSKDEGKEELDTITRKEIESVLASYQKNHNLAVDFLVNTVLKV